MLLLLMGIMMHIHRDPPQLVLVINVFVRHVAPTLQEWGKHLLLFHSLVHSSCLVHMLHVTYDLNLKKSQL